MTTLTSEVNISFDYGKIDDLYDFYQIKTTQKYIAKGARILDDLGTYTPVLSITFGTGSSAFVMFKKNTTDLQELNKAIQDDSLMVKHIKSSELQDLILARLFLYSLTNSSYEEYVFNNLTGKFFVFLPSKNMKEIKAVQMDFSSLGEKLKLDCIATTFYRDDKFLNDSKIKNYPHYEVSVHNTLKRVFYQNSKKHYYVHKSVFNSKTRINFMDFSKKNYKACKSFLIYQAINQYNNKFENLSHIGFVEKQITRRIESKKDEYFFDSVLVCLKDKTVNLVNYTKELEYQSLFKEMAQIISKRLPYSNVVISKSIQVGNLNIVFIHNREYYQDQNINDPYKDFKRNTVVQCITVEEISNESNSDIILKTILKELAIKDDIIYEHKINLDDWSAFRFKNNWVFGMAVEDKSYFIEIDPMGNFKTIKGLGPFSQFKTEKYINYDYLLQSSKGKGKLLIADDCGNINIIYSTGINAIPYSSVFDDLSRSKESIRNYLGALTGINLYHDEGGVFYSVGNFASGLNSSLANGVLFYQCAVLNGENIIDNILETMSVLFVKWDSYTVLPYPAKYLREWIAAETEL